MNEITLIEKLTPAEIYTDKKIDQIISKITEEAKAYKPNLETASGRKELASLAYKIAQSKTYLDDCGKKLGEEAKKTLETINSERKKIRDSLDILKEEIRRPLTEWEKKDEDRKTILKNDLSELDRQSKDFYFNWQQKPSEAFDVIIQNFTQIKAIDWQEFADEAAIVFKAAEERIALARERKIQFDKDQLELAKLRAEKEERDRLEADRIEKDREQSRLLAEAEQKKKFEELAKKEAELREQKRLEREKQISIEKEQAIAHEKELADKRVNEAQEKAQRDKEAAIENERQIRFKEVLAQQEAEKKRQANLKHRTKINNEILTALKDNGLLDVEIGKKIIRAIVTGAIPYTKINY